jgi:hypothetical protein
MVAGLSNTNGFGTFLALSILAITFRVLKLIPKTSRIWKQDCSGYLLMHRYMNIAHIYWSWEWPELDHFFVHPILPKHRSACNFRGDRSKWGSFGIFRIFAKMSSRAIFLFLHGFSSFFAWSYFRTWT